MRTLIDRTLGTSRTSPGTSRWCWRGGLVALLVAGLGASPGAALGQAKSKPSKLIRIEGITIEGRIQKPQAFYILQRSNLNFEGLELKKSFVPKIIKSVDEAPF